MARTRYTPWSKPHRPSVPKDLAKILNNLGALATAGLLITSWILFYTDWYWLPAISGLLTLGGAFAWVALIPRLVSEERRKQLQSALERFLLLRRQWWRGVAVVAAALLTITMASSSLVVRSYADDTDRSLRISSGEASDTIRESLLPGHSSRKFLLFGRGPFRVKLSGLPSATVRARPFLPMVLSSPDSFTCTPFVLLRPTLAMSQVAAESGALRLAVWRGNEVLVEPRPFRGRAIWLAGESDLTIPKEIRQRWNPEEAVQWLPPESTDGIGVLTPGDELRVHILTASGILYGPEIRHLVEGLDDSQTFVQEIVIDIPH